MDALHYHRILLVRAGPGTWASRQGRQQAEAWRDEGGRLLVFFHGEGVEHATGDAPAAVWRRLAGWHGVVLAVCSGSWARRHAGEPPDPFVVSSLTAFWNHALQSGEVECFGVGRAE